MIPHPRLASNNRASRRRVHTCTCEVLESRTVMSAAAYAPSLVFGALPVDEDPAVLPLHGDGGTDFPGGVHVTATEIITKTEVIPRFVAQPTITSIRAGSWSNPSTWSADRVPTSGDRVRIDPGHVVIYATTSNARIDGLEINGSLVFSPYTNTRLLVANLTVMPTGVLQIGTAAAPIAAQKTAELVIADQSLDLAKDPRQYGTGLIALGTVTIHGSTLNQTWTKLAAEPRAGSSVLVLSSSDPTWQAGDTLVLPDTRQVKTSQQRQFDMGELPPQWEEVTIDRVVGNQVFLTRVLQFDHLGARDADGVLKLLPHVAILDRNVIIRSENPQGTRGHVLTNARAKIDIEYARFKDLGRTDAFRSLDNTTFDALGNVTHVGTNQIGRYAVHFHHMMGPENPSNTGYQFQFVGNTVDGARKWAVAVHDTSYGLLDSNVVYNAQGAGFVTEDGSEIENRFSNNFTVRIRGTQVDGKSGTQENDYGRGGSGFWFRRTGNYVTGNVAADSSFAGFVIDGYYNWDPATLPLFRGAEKHEPGQGSTTKLNPSPALINNEAYGLSSHGMWMAYPVGDNLRLTQPETLFFNLRLWNVSRAGVMMYHTSHVTFQLLTIYGDNAAQDRNDEGTFGMYLAIYENRDLSIRYARIEGVRFGIVAPKSDASEAGRDRPTLIEHSILKNYINLLVTPAWDYGPGNGTLVVVKDVLFGLLPNLPTGPAAPANIDPPANIQMKLMAADANLTQRSTVKVYNYNRVAGDDFQVFYREQAASYVMPQTDPALLAGGTIGTVGSPEAGLTNAANWLKYQIAVAGAVAPATAAESRPEVNGLVGPITATPAVPRLALATPWNGAVISGIPPVRIRYNVNGQLPANSWVFFSLDGGYPFANYIDGGIFNVAPGWHTLRSWIGNVMSIPVPGTWGAVTTFYLADDFRIGSGGSAVSAGPSTLVAADQTTLDATVGGAIAFALAMQSDRDSPPVATRPASSASPPELKVPQTTLCAAESTDGRCGEILLAIEQNFPAEDSLGDELLGELAADVAATGPRVV